MIRLVIRGEVEAVVQEFAERLKQSVAASLECDGKPLPSKAGTRVLGPAPAPNPRIRGKYRFQIQLQGPDGDTLRTAVRSAEGIPAPNGVEWIADVDPLSML
jgi:primosomal protein N'